MVSVRTFHDDGLIITHSRRGKFHLMEIRLAFNIQFILLATKYLQVIVVESIEVRNLYSLVYINCSPLARMNSGELNVSVWQAGPIEG